MQHVYLADTRYNTQFINGSGRTQRTHGMCLLSHSIYAGCLKYVYYFEFIVAFLYDVFFFLVEQILPENLKTEEMCSKVWSKEIECDCQWENSLSRRTSHRNRMAAAKAHRENSAARSATSSVTSIASSSSDQENSKKSNFEEWRASTTYESFEDDDEDEDVFWVSLMSNKK